MSRYIQSKFFEIVYITIIYFTGTDKMDGSWIYPEQDVHPPEWCMELR